MLASAALLTLSGGCAGHRNPALAVVNWFEPLDGGRDHVSPYFANLYALSLVRHGLGAGEVRGYHHGPYREGWFHWYSRGYTPAGVEMLNGIRGLDLLAQHPEVNPDRLGVTGISGGGATMPICRREPSASEKKDVRRYSTIAMSAHLKGRLAA